MWLRSSLLEQVGFPKHGFTTRTGGVSEGAYASWNFSTSTGDQAEAVEENIRLLASRLDVRRTQIRSVSQIHSDRVMICEEAEQETAHEEADALLSFVPELVVGVKTADCVPLLIAERKTRAVAAIHAGWRGVVSAIAVRVVEHLQARIAAPEIFVAIGPHISAEVFQVGAEVAAYFPEAARPDPNATQRHLVDLRAALVSQLFQAGVPVEQIDHVHGCTVSDASTRFFSHRASGGRCGRMFNFIAGGA